MGYDPVLEILKKEFSRKKEKNKAYSLRSFSRDLGIDPSNLSRILKAKVDIGPKLRKKLGEKLGISPEEMQSLEIPSQGSRTRDQDYVAHNLEVFQTISEWQHYALLEYLKLPNASSKPSIMAEHFGLKLATVNESLKRLLKTGMLRKDGDNFIPTEKDSSSILNIATSKFHRDQQKQILEGAISALEDTAVEFRSQSSMTMAIDSEKLPQAKILIKNFRRDLGRLLSSSSRLDGVFQLSISLYPVSETFKTKENL